MGGRTRPTPHIKLSKMEKKTPNPKSKDGGKKSSKSGKPGKPGKDAKPGKPINFYWVYAIVAMFLLTLVTLGDSSSQRKVQWPDFKKMAEKGQAVSYTHLTLPTIRSV